MRILIYSETEEAKALLATLRGEGHHASLRNPQYFNPAQFDKNCEAIYTDSDVIGKAYYDAGIEANRLTMPARQAEKIKPEPEEETGESDLHALTVAQLRALAEERGIDLAGLTKKADIIAAIEAVDGAKPE